MGLCTEHAIREETEIWSGGYPFPSEKVKGTLPRILCPYCYNVMKED